MSLAVFLSWLEASALGVAVRASGVWAYAVINLVHILGVATLFGAILVLDLRLLGLWHRLPLTTVATPALPVAVCGVALAFLSGICLLATNGSEYVGNPFLLIKFPAIALGLCNVIAISRMSGWRARRQREPLPRERRQLAYAGGLSLLCWLTAIAAGRLIGYW